MPDSACSEKHRQESRSLVSAEGTVDFFELHCGLPREGPGDDGTTASVLHSLPGLPTQPEILDIGCGPGAQTLVLAQQTGGRVTAVDLHQPFLEELMRRAHLAGISDLIKPVCASMDGLPFEAVSFDLIWSEGAIYIIGFETGLRIWRRFLRDLGIMVVSEATWLTNDRPKEATEFWSDAYPAMKSREDNRAIITRCGYEPVAEILLPNSSWFSEYYNPLERRISELEVKYASQPEALRFLESERLEITIARRHPNAVGYVFYIMRRLNRADLT